MDHKDFVFANKTWSDKEEKESSNCRNHVRQKLSNSLHFKERDLKK